MAMMMMLATRKAVMGQFTVGPILNGFGWLATGVMALAGIGMFVTMR
jgi:Mn2+/Fe2+ NRAMP family transporter